MTEGTLPRSRHFNAQYCAREDGTEVNFQIIEGLSNEGTGYSIRVKWPGNQLWTNVIDTALFGNEYIAIQSILRNAGLWQTNNPGGVGPTWEAILGGAEYTADDGRLVSGEMGVESKFYDWAKGVTTRAIHEATPQWVDAVLVPFINAMFEMLVNGVPAPAPEPPPPTPEQTFPLNQVGACVDADGMILALGGRIRLRRKAGKLNHVEAYREPV